MPEIRIYLQILGNMVSSSPVQNQFDMFQVLLTQILKADHPIKKLGDDIPWHTFEVEFSKLYSETGRPGHPIRRMVGFLMLKSMFNQSDESLVELWVENPYWQYFTGECYFQHKAPFDPSELVHFRNRIGVEGAEKIFKVSIQMHGKKSLEKEAISDTTVQEKNITYPTDAKQQIKVVRKCVAIATESGIELRQTYKRTIKKLLLDLRFRNHVRNKKKGRKAAKRLKTIANVVIRDLERKLTEQNNLNTYQSKIDLYKRVVNQERKEKNKIYSIHEPTVSCIAKGKEHKPFEFGCKVNLIITKTTNIIIGAMHFQGNPYDGDTLEPTLNQVERLTGQRPGIAITDRGFRGRSKLGETQVITPVASKKGQTNYEKQKARKRFRRRAAIEPKISHLKADFRMGRNFLRGIPGDGINLLMAAAAANFKKLLRELTALLIRLLNVLWCQIGICQFLQFGRVRKPDLTF